MNGVEKLPSPEVSDDVKKLKEEVMTNKVEQSIKELELNRPSRPGFPTSAKMSNQPPPADELDDYKVCPLSKHHAPEVDWRSMSNRELANSKDMYTKEFSELMFNQRVLFAALDPKVPLLERFKFCCIVSSNMDEVYAKRLGNIPKFDEEDEEDRNKNYKKLIRPKTRFEEELASAVSDTVDALYDCLLTQLLPQMKELGVEILTRKKLNAQQRRNMTTYFKKKILPILTPLSVDQTHPFPLLQSHGIYLAVVLLNPETDKTRRVYLRVPPVKPRAVQLDNEGLKYIPIEEIVLDNMNLVTEGMQVLKAYPFRVTRNVKLVIDDAHFGESDNLLDFVWEEVHRRRSAPATRLEVTKDMPAEFLDLLVKELILDSTDVFVFPCNLVGLADFMSISFSAPFAEHRDAPHTPKVPKRFEGLEEKLLMEPGKVFNQIRKQDILVEYPKHSFKHSSALFLRAAARDTKVRVIKCCLYRGGDDSPLVASLIRAAKSGKEVSVLVELKASFDEVQNSEYARKLRRAGCNVSYGMLGLKAHCKLILVVREEESGFRPYANVATGNFNPGTAKIYTDQSLFTCRENICSDVIDLYNALFGYSRKRNYNSLLVAPVNMLSGFISLIRKEADNARKAQKAHIIVQVNGLTEPSIVEELYAASQAGVKIDLIVRGICCIRPGLQGKSENVNVYSWIGRFLQHQRIYYFYDGGKEHMYIGSADWRSRNLKNRVEVCTPVEDSKLFKKLYSTLQFFLKDTRNTWRMASDGRYYIQKPKASVKSITIEKSSELEDEYATSAIVMDAEGDGSDDDDVTRYRVMINGAQVAVTSVLHMCIPVRAIDDKNLSVLLVQSGKSTDEVRTVWSFPQVTDEGGNSLLDAVQGECEKEAGVTGGVVDYIPWKMIGTDVAADFHIFQVEAEEEWAGELSRGRLWMTLPDAIDQANKMKDERQKKILEAVQKWFAHLN